MSDNIIIISCTITFIVFGALLPLWESKQKVRWLSYTWIVTVVAFLVWLMCIIDARDLNDEIRKEVINDSSLIIFIFIIGRMAQKIIFTAIDKLNGSIEIKKGDASISLNSAKGDTNAAK